MCRVCKDYTKHKTRMPMILVKLYGFQICRAIAYIHALGVCHAPDLTPVFEEFARVISSWEREYLLLQV